MRKRWLPASLSARWVLGITLGLLCGPVLLDLAASGRTGPFTYVAADTFYYLTVARNIARHGLASYDGQHLTNGFHPLWQIIIGGLNFVTERLGEGQYTVLVAVVASLALVAGGIVLLGRAFAEGGTLPPLFALLPVGVYGLLLAPFWLARLGVIAQSMEGPYPVYGTLWSYANGMESGAVLFSLGLCAYFQQAWGREPARSRALYFGLSVAALVLSRLDHVLIGLPLVALFCVAARKRRGTEGHAAIALLAFGLPIAFDIAVNVIVFGAVVPVSGALKLTFPLMTPVHIQSWLNNWAAWKEFNLFEVQREASLVVPIVFALGYLPLTLRVVPLGSTLLLHYREGARGFDRFLVPVAIGVILFGSHEILFLDDGPGSWHLPVSTLFVSLAVVAVVNRAPLRLGRRATFGALGLIGCLTIAFFVKLRQPAYHASLANFYLREAPSLRQSFHGKPPQILEFDDGIVNYSLDIPAMSNGLALDPEGLDARRGGHLYALAYERGFNCLSSLLYQSAAALAGESSSEAALRYAKGLLSEDISAFDFDVSYVTPSASLAIVCGHKK